MTPPHHHRSAQAIVADTHPDAPPAASGSHALLLASATWLLTLTTALAQPTAQLPVTRHAPQPTAPMTSKPAGAMSRGVLMPKADIDPGMTTRPPAMAATSTPVIRPKATGDGGSIVVPR